MKKTFYRDIAKVVWHPYLPMWVECMIKCLQITKFIHSKLSQEFTKSRSWLVTRTIFIALLPSEEVVDLHPWQVKILVSNKYDTLCMKMFHLFPVMILSIWKLLIFHNLSITDHNSFCLAWFWRHLLHLQVSYLLVTIFRYYINCILADFRFKKEKNRYIFIWIF